MTRATRAVIDLAALQHNLGIARRLAAPAKVMAIIKANAYGHGMLQVARALQSADAFGVATLDEALQLRQAGIHKTIILLEGFSRVSELEKLRQHGFEIVLHQEQQLAALEGNNQGPAVGVWFKIDTGMHRLGFAPVQVAAMYQRAVNCKSIKKPITLFTHFANADDRRDPATARQLQVFKQTIEQTGAGQSAMCIANSAGILGWSESHAQWVRPGIMLYGVSPFNDSTAAEHDLKPVMTLQSELLAISMRQRGDRIGYGGSYSCPEAMPVGVVAIGYGDGYPRHAKAGTPVLLNGQRVPLIGRVSMDMITVDLRTQPDAKIGDTVTLWGEGLPVEEIARHADTIGYQLLCGVTSRVTFDYR